jgi:NTE family protein
MIKKLVLILLSLCIYSLNAQRGGRDLKVGLVLSGGGAKGLAHIGALKTIDSLGVKVDYIAGTSMGAIIGSLYASGYSGMQLDSIFNSLNFDEVINDVLPRASKTFYERENSEKYALTLPFDEFKLHLPSAISRGQNIFNLLSKLTLHVSHISDFEQLPIPFFCIATNIETGEAVMLDNGSLPQAIAASGAFPSLLQPVYIDDQMLIDGGVVNNYPIDELRAKGMDIIIGVDVQDDLADRKELETAPEILIQINNFRTINDMKVKSKKTDIYIKPDIDDFNVVSFNDGRLIIEKGKIAANRLAGELQKITERIGYAPRMALKVPKTDSIKIKGISVQGNKRYTRSYILGKLKLKRDEKISYKDFNKGVNNLVATKNFDSFIYEFQPNEDGYNLITHLKESEIKTFLKFGVHYDDLYKSAALVNLTKTRAIFNNDVMSIDLILGDNVRYNFDYFIDKGYYWSVGLKSRYNSFHRNIDAALILEDDDMDFEGLNKIDVELSDLTNQFFVQTLFRKDLSLRLGMEHKRLKITSETFVEGNNDEEETIFENSDFFSLFGQLKFDTYNNRYFPNNGFLFDGDFHLFLSSSDFNDNFAEFSFAKAKIGYAIGFSDKFSVIVGSEGGFKIGDDSNNSLNFALGGYGNNFINNFISFYGYDYLSITGSGFVKGSLDLDYEIFKKQHILFSANFANVGDEIFKNGNWLSTPDYSGYAAGYSLETFLGPIEIKYTWSPEIEKARWFFNVGFWF